MTDMKNIYRFMVELEMEIKADNETEAYKTAMAAVEDYANLYTEESAVLVVDSSLMKVTTDGWVNVP